MTRLILGRSWIAGAAVLLAAAAAGAQSVHEIQPGGDTVTGDIVDAAQVDRIPIRLVDGALFSVTLKAAKGSTLLPDLALLGTDRQPDAAAAALVKPNSKGNVLSLKSLPVVGTGLRWMEVRSKSGTTGGWILTTKVKVPKGATATGSVNALAGPTSFPFTGPGNATAAIVVAAAKGSTAVPAFVDLLDTNGASLQLDEVLPGKKGFTAKNAYLAKPGIYTLVVDPGTGADGAITVKITWKIPKPVKRALLESQVVTDPVVTAVDPTGGDNSQRLATTVTVDFALPGVLVTFRKAPTVVSLQGNALTVTASSISFQLNLTVLQKGIYDVEVQNTNGGKGVLPGAFTVVNAAAQVDSINPVFGYDNQVVQITVTGAYINGSATATLKRSGQTIPGTGVLAAGTSLTATFDLRGGAIGYWDMVVANPDAAETTLAGAFQIRNSPPTPTSITPADNLASNTPTCTIGGTDFDATPTALLRKSGKADIPATSMVWVSGTQLQCHFDVSAAANGLWDLVVANPDANTGTLANAFLVSGPVAPAAKALSAVSTADCPPAVCYDATQNQFLLGWVDVDANAGTWDSWIQRVDTAGATVGSKVNVSSSANTVLKRDIAIAWDSFNDRYLVSWVEPRSVTISSTTHPSYGYTSTTQVFAQAFKGSDLTTVGNFVQVTDATNFAGWIMSDFNNFRPSVCYDAKNKVFVVAFTQEWSSRNINKYGYDDYDVITRSVDPSSGTPLGTPTGIATSGDHEAEAVVAYDPGTQSIFSTYVFRSGTVSPPPPLQVILAGTAVGNDSGADLTDPQITVDTDAKRLITTWTSSVLSGGSKSVKGMVSSTASPGGLIGSIVAVGTGSVEDHFLVRSIYNASLKNAMLTWTKKAGGSLSVRYRLATTTGTAGLALLGTEKEASGASGDEATPAPIYSPQAGESVLFWMKTMSFASANSYPGSTLGGVYRGKEFWVQRFK